MCIDWIANSLRAGGKCRKPEESCIPREVTSVSPFFDAAREVNHYFKMPGANCCMPGCSVSSLRCSTLITFHGIPNGKADAEWRAALIHKINRADTLFNPKNARICSRHFEETCFKYGPTGKRALIPGSLPTNHVLQKSVETPKTPARKPPVSRPPPPTPDLVAYYNFEEIRQDTLQLAAPWCLLENSKERIQVGITEASQVKLRVVILPDFTVRVHVYGFHASSALSTIEHVRLNQFLLDLHERELCPGITEAGLQRYADLPSGDNHVYFKHVLGYCLDKSGVSCVSCVRSSSCTFVLNVSSNMCVQCNAAKNLLMKKQQRASESALRPMSKHDPLHSTPKAKLSAAFKTARKNERALQLQVDKFVQDLAEANNTVEVDNSLHNSLKDVVNKTPLEEPLTKMFWEEQQKAFSRKGHGMRWHPMMIRLAILLHSKSPAVYETLRQTGILKLPGESTLRDYTNVFGPKDGFNKQAVDELVRQSKELKEEERFVVLLHDEMAIRADLVFDQRTNQVVGFINKDNWTNDIGNNLATHVLVFYVVGVNSNIKLSLGFFGTSTATAGDLFPLLWKAVECLENCSLKVIASTSDKASANQKLYSMHQGPGIHDICYKVPNLFSPDRFLYFFSDPPHLIKTVRNNMSNSGSGRNTNRLWNNGHDILWQHVRRLYNVDSETELRHTKLTQNHVNLTSSSVMNVKLAAQVLSKSVGTMMQVHGGDEAAETSTFILLMDRFFDCLNVRSNVEGKQKRKPDLNPYTAADDARFTFLQEDFLGYLDQWKQSVCARPGPFTLQERNKMFLTHQTFKGLVMTVKSFCEVAQYLLRNGVPQVLSNVFCQDPLEEHFGRHRGLGRRCDNPNLLAFAYQEDRIRLQRSLALQLQPRGNIERRMPVPVVISTSPLKKIQRRH